MDYGIQQVMDKFIWNFWKGGSWDYK